jgi:hypothetical protein
MRGGRPATGREKAVKRNLVSHEAFQCERTLRPQSAGFLPRQHAFNRLFHLFLSLERAGAVLASQRGTFRPGGTCFSDAIIKWGRRAAVISGRARHLFFQKAIAALDIAAG